MVRADCHIHIFMNGSDYRAARDQYRRGVDEADVRRKLQGYADAGITYLRDGGDPYGAGMFARQIAPEYGITYRSPVFAIHREGCYGAIVGRAFTDMKEYAALVREVRLSEGDFIKVMFSGILDFASDGSVSGTPLTRGEITEMIHIAHEEGYAVMAHVNGAVPVLAAIEAGLDSIEHGYYMDETCLQALAESHCVWVPTLSPVCSMIGAGRFDDALLERIALDQQRNVLRALELGALVASGSDAGAWMVPHVQAAMDEDRYLHQIPGPPGDLDERLEQALQEIRTRF